MTVQIIYADNSTTRIYHIRRVFRSSVGDSIWLFGYFNKEPFRKIPDGVIVGIWED